MSNHIPSSAAFCDTKPHYDLLDGLRGVAALLVVWYHVFEGYAFAGGKPYIECINHGYLAVDFFFILSGFVIGYAYDDRWNKSLTMKGFFQRRLIRLHPMVIMGAVLGTITFLVQGSVQWDGTHVATSAVMLALLLAMCFIPAVPGCGYEVRGNGEMFPLNGPTWSLFFEYVANVGYVLCLRRLRLRHLVLLALASGIALAWVLVGHTGTLGVGWSAADGGWWMGLLRVTFPFTLGQILARLLPAVQRLRPVRGAFWLCAALLVVFMAVPHVGGEARPWLNGLYEMACVALLFPAVVCMGAVGRTTDAFSTRLCDVVGQISYPLYAIHYPVLYLYFAWIWQNNYTLADVWPVSLALFFCMPVLAYAFWRWYDLPVRRRLSRRG